MSLDNPNFSDTNTKPEIKNKAQNEELKFKMECELLVPWPKDEVFLSNYLKTFHNINISALNTETKKKLWEEIQIIFDELKGYKPSMSKNLKAIRENMSMWLENWKNETYYNSLIIWNKINTRFIILQEVLRIIEWKNLDEKDAKIKKVFDIVSSQKWLNTKWFWINHLQWFMSSWYEELEKTYSDKLVNIENMSEADLVILLRTLFSIIPVAWDVVWWKDDLQQANAWVNADGSIQWFWENIFLYLTWSLWITVVWGKIWTLAKWPKLTKVFFKMEQIIWKLENLPNLEKLAKNENFMKLLEKMKWKIPSVDKLLIKLRTKNEWIKVTNTFISQLNDEEFIQFLHKNNIDSLNISQLSSKELTRLNHIITNNFPLVQIWRLIPGEKLVNINISWIKKINDIAWQEFCDEVLFKFKEILKSHFEKGNISQNHKWRVVKNDYKNITFVTNWEKPLELIFWKVKNKEEILKKVLVEMQENILKNAKNIISEQAKKWEIIITSQKHFDQLVAKKVNDTKEVVLKNFDFWVWESIIPKNSDDIMKLDTIRKAEISSRVWLQKETLITLKEFNKTELIESISIALEWEKVIIEKFKWQKFIFEWIQYNIVQNNNGVLSLSTELLRYMRKYPEKIQPEELAIMTKNYINLINGVLDFISPLKWELKSNNSEFLRAKSINDQIKTWIIDTSSLIESFKWWVTKTAFFEIIQKQFWTKIFIDIKDMWIDNLVDFNLRAKQILKLQEDFKIGKIDIKTLEEKQTKLFLEAGKSVSDKFIEIQKRITKKYPDATISFWWDEIYLFIPENKLLWIEEIQSNLTNIFHSSNQKARIVIDAVKETTQSKENYSQLEKITKLNKIIEETIEKQLTKKWIKLDGNIPENTYIKMNDFVRQKIMSDNFNIDDFFKNIITKVEKQNLIGIEKKDIFLWEIWDWVKVTLTKIKNNQVEIYLHNN